MLVVQVLRIVVTRKLHDIRALLRVRVAHVVGANGCGRVLLRVVFQDIIVQALGYVKAVRVDGVVYLVADAPHYNARVIAVALYPAAYVALRIFNIETVVVVFGLSLFPHIKGFAVNEKSHLVAELHKLSCRHIVRCTDSIHAHLLHHTELTCKRCGIHSGAESAKVVVHADTVHFDHPAVKDKSSVDREFSRTVAESLVHTVKKLVAAVKADFQRVKHRVVDIPQLRGVALKTCRELLLAAVKMGFQAVACCGAPVRVEDLQYHADIRSRTGNICFHLSTPGSVIKLIGMDIHAVCADICLRAKLQRNVTENARSRIPAGIRSFMQYAHKYLVIALMQKVGYVEFERGVAVGPSTSFPAVHKYCRIEVNPVEIQQHPAGKHIAGAVQNTLVPALASFVKSGRVVYQPVVRKLHIVPVLACKSRKLHSGLAQAELPAVVKKSVFSGHFLSSVVVLYNDSNVAKYCCSTCSNGLKSKTGSVSFGGASSNKAHPPSVRNS